MAININVDETNIKNVITAFKDMLNNLDDEVDKAMIEVMTKGEGFLNAQYVSRVKDPNITDISTSWNKKDNEYELKSSGKDVIYEEFGTGDEGERQPHEAKKNYKLNKYNSGGTITDVSMIHDDAILNVLAEHGITSGKFWYYQLGDGGSFKAPQLNNEQKMNRARFLVNHASEVVLTQGVPAGQEMWDTRNYLIKNVIPKTFKRRSEYICEKFKRTVEK